LAILLSNSFTVFQTNGIEELIEKIVMITKIIIPVIST